MKELIYYVSPSGSDEWNGVAPEFTHGINGPCATIKHAQSLIRKLLASGCDSKIKILIRGGRYFLDSPLVFTTQDSGSEKAPVVYAAYEDESPIFSGGKQIRHWDTATINGKKCWVADLKNFPADKLNFTQLFVNGERRERTRLPRKGFYHFAALPEDLPPYGGFTKGPDRAIFKEGDIQDWKNPKDIEIIVLQYWFDTHHKIRKLDFKSNEVSFVNKSLGTLKDEKSDMARYFIENVLEAVEHPGDWYLDRKAALLYYIPYHHEDIKESEIIVPVLETIVSIEGAWIRLENLCFKHAEWKPPVEFAGSIQAAFQVPGAVQFCKANHCVIYDCEISQVSQYAVQVGTGSNNNKIVACSMYDLGAGGIKIEHEWIEHRGITSPVELKRHKNYQKSNTTVSDCSIHDASKIYLSAIGIWIGNTGANKIFNNHIFNINYTGISVGWTWNYDDTATIGNIIKANHIHHINWKNLLSDNGGIYTLGNSPGSIYSDNHIHHVGCYGYGGWGIYHDQATSGQLVENNVVHHTKHAGFFTHYGRDNIVRNNIFALADCAHVSPGSMQDNHRSTIIENNIVYWKHDVPGIGFKNVKKWNKHYFLLRNNLFWAQGAEITFEDGKTLADWQKEGQFCNTLVADPLFTDPDAGDFSLQANSPADKIAFKELNTKNSGPRFSENFPVSYDDWKAAEYVEKPITLTTIKLIDNSSGILTISNQGTIPVSGKLSLNAGPADEIKIINRTAIELSGLLPGESMSAEFNFKISPDAKMFFIEALGTGEGLMSSYIYKTMGEQVQLKKVSSCSKPEMVADCLAALSWEQMTNTMGFSLAQMRYALSGDKLIMQVRSSDPEVTPNYVLPYEGSCVELFMSPDEKITQLFAIPSEDRTSVSFMQRHLGRPISIDSIIGTCQHWDEGYELNLIIPLTIADISIDSDKFYFELAVSGFWDKDIKTRLALFNALAPSESTEACGIMKI